MSKKFTNIRECKRAAKDSGTTSRSFCCYFPNFRVYTGCFSGTHNSMMNHSEQRVRYAQLQVFYDLHVIRRDDHAEIAELPHLAAFEPRQTDIDCTCFARRLTRQQYIR